MASKEARDARLDKLADAAEAWAKKETQRLNKETTLLKTILKGRTGSERLNNASVETGSELLVDELNQFLTGD